MCLIAWRKNAPMQFSYDAQIQNTAAGMSRLHRFASIPMVGTLRRSSATVADGLDTGTILPTFSAFSILTLPHTLKKKFEVLSRDDLNQMLGTEVEFSQRSDEPRVLLERETPWYEDTDWRTIKGSTLKKVGALLVINRQGNCRIRFPAMYKGKRVGHVTGLWVKSKHKNAPSYLESKHMFNGKPWSQTHVLFYDYCRKKLKKYPDKPLFIVEGPRDALKLIEYGLLAVPILGTQKNLDEKIDIIFELNPKRFILMLDGDAAGEHGADTIEEKLNRRHVDVRRFNLPDETDPAMLPKRLARKIEKIYGYD